MKIVIPVNEPTDIWTLPGKMAYRGGFFCPPGVELDPATGVAAYIRDIYRLAGRLRGPKGPDRPKLIINEAGAESDQGGTFARANLLKLLKMMQAEGLPLDGVGLEAHLQPQMMFDPLKPDWGPFGAFLDEVADLGLEIHLTELDVLDFVTSCNGRMGTSAESDRLVAHYFETFLTRALACRAVKSICLWDLSDRYSFYRAMNVDTWFGYDQLPRGSRPTDWPKCDAMPAATAVACPRADVYDDRYQAKPAREAIARALASAPSRG
jgi:endo-1,4-beta-xylanase